MIDLPPSLTEREQIERLAYHLYEDEGNPDGRADEHWAERRNLFTPNASPSPLLWKNQKRSQQIRL